MKITDAEFQEIVAYMKKHFGINLSAKRTLVAGRLENYLIQHGYESYGEYFEKVFKDGEASEEGRMLVNFLTTNHTYFWREPIHFEYLRNKVLPDLAVQEKRSKCISLWCGAAATGEEPYTIVMILQDFFGSYQGNWDTRILATDISTKALEKAKTGVYLNEQLDPLPDVWKRVYFTKHSQEESKVVDKIRNDVIFRTQNLMEPFRFKRKFHVIFLRNVMIYFEEETKTRLVNTLYDCLEDGGYLFIGAAENLDRQKVRLTYVQPSIYRKL